MKNPFEKLSKKTQKESSQNTEWDNLNTVEFAGDTEKTDPETAKAERQQRKITAYLLYGKNPEYISAPDIRLNPNDPNNLSEQLTNGTITRNDERDLLLNIKDPVRKIGRDNVFSSLRSNKHHTRILANFTEAGFNNWQQTTPHAIETFLSKYPTPLDFDAESEIFLNKLGSINTPEKYQEYLTDMASFKTAIYGKRQEYWEQIKALEKQAEEWKQQKTVEKPTTTGEHAESLIKEFGYYEMSRAQTQIGMIANNPGDRLPEDYTEDAHLEMPEQGLFAVFDGAGGTSNENGGARIASQTAAAKVKELATKYNLENEGNLAWALNEASQAIEANPKAGMTTGAVAKVVEQNGTKKLAFASVGDSRIYIVRQNSFAFPITKDEGEGKYITNALGRIKNQDSSNRTKQLGIVDLWPGDRIVLCTDGITGDKPEEQMTENQIAAIVGLAWDTSQSAAELVETARKKDDRTAIVFQV